MRHCIEENGECPHHQIKKGKRCCGLLGKGFILSSKMPQKFCPIESGKSINVKLNYENLMKYTTSPSWAKIIEAR
jgi:hypothetical protein